MVASSDGPGGKYRKESLRVAQMTLDFEPGLTERHSLLSSCIREAAHRSPRPMKAIAADCDMSESTLSRKLNGHPDDSRHLSVDELVMVVDATGDLSPIYWLIERFAIADDQRQARAQAELAKLLPTLVALAKQAGVGS
jgi:hypothetical protein